MRYIILLFIFGICGCNYASDNNAAINTINEAKNVVCDRNYDTLLVKYANEFYATTIALNGSLSSDLKEFLLSVDTNCLRQQKEYKYFIALILGKLALHHLKCCNQHYDLYQMRDSAAAIINEFNRLAGYEGQRLEMLNSGLIKDYIQNDKMLLSDPTLTSIIDAMKKEEERIEKGVF